MKREIINVAQNTPEWKLHRTGRITASKFKDATAAGEGKTRRKYMLEVIGERLTGEPAENYKNQKMERGHIYELEARAYYEMISGTHVNQVGLITLGDDFGASPDGLVMSNGMIEIKNNEPHILLEIKLADRIPPEHLKQIYGGMFVAGVEWCDFISYWPGINPFIKRVYRDRKIIKSLMGDIIKFRDEMLELMEKIKKI